MNCAQPIYKHDRLTETDVTNAIFIPRSQESADYDSGLLSWQHRAQLYFINRKQVNVPCSTPSLAVLFISCEATYFLLNLITPLL